MKAIFFTAVKSLYSRAHNSKSCVSLYRPSISSLGGALKSRRVFFATATTVPTHSTLPSLGLQAISSTPRLFPAVRLSGSAPAGFWNGMRQEKSEQWHNESYGKLLSPPSFLQTIADLVFFGCHFCCFQLPHACSHLRLQTGLLLLSQSVSLLKASHEHDVAFLH